MLSDNWLSRYRLLENFNKVEREQERERVRRGDYNSSFALRAVELKMTVTLYIKTILILELNMHLKYLGIKDP